MKKFTVLLVTLALAAGILAGCGSASQTTTTAAATEATTASGDASGDVTTLGEGKTVIYVEVVDADENVTNFEVKTDETVVGDALTDVGLIEGEEGDYGLYVTTVNGVTVDYDKDQTYWAFYIDGEYAMTGVDSTDITDGSTYSFKIEK